MRIDKLRDKTGFRLLRIKSLTTGLESIAFFLKGKTIMKKNPRVINIGMGRECPKCKGLCIVRKRIQKQSRHKNFYYTQWDFCENCNAVYFEEKYKCSEWKEVEQQEDLFRNLRNEK